MRPSNSRGRKDGEEEGCPSQIPFPTFSKVPPTKADTELLCCAFPSFQVSNPTRAKAMNATTARPNFTHFMPFDGVSGSTLSGVSESALRRILGLAVFMLNVVVVFVRLAGSGATWYCGPKQRHRTKKKKHPPTVECIIVRINTVANFSVVKISEHVITNAVTSVVEDEAKIEGPM